MLNLREIYKIYNKGETCALKNISLLINKGEFLSIVGTSGSGKTTLMNILGCLDVPTSGSYELDGMAVQDMSEDELAKIRNEKIGFVFQGFQLVPELTAFQNVELPLIFRGMPKANRKILAENALESVGLAERMQHRPSELSGGQQQRVAIARAIAACPPVILADEPTGNLDPRSAMEILSLLSELNRRGHTVVLITHDEKVAKRAHRIIEIQHGKII